MSYYTNTNSRSYTDARVKDLYLDGTIIPGIPIPVIQPLINYSNVDPNNGLVDINGLTRDFGDLNAPRLEIGNPAQGQGEGYYYKQNNNYEEKISAPGGDKLINLESLDETYATAVISSAGTDYTIRAVEDVVIESTGNPGSVTISAGVNPGDVSDVRLISTRDTTINAARDVGIEAGETLEAFSNQEVLITALDNIDIEARGNAGFAQISHTIAPNSSFLQLKVNDTSVLSAFDDLDILQGENSINMNGVTLNIERETANTIFKVAMDNASVLMEASDKATSKRGTVEVADDFISNQVTNAGADISRVELEPGIFRADLPIAGSPGGIINSLNTTLPTPTSSLVVASALTNNSSFTVTPDKLELNSNYGGVNRQFRIENGQYYMTNAPVAAQTHAVGINQLTGELTIVDNNFQSLSLVGNPIHAFANTSGNLIYRGMTSPDGSINLSVDANNINLSVASPDAFENGVFQAALNPGINFTNLDCSPSAFGASVTQTINAVPINYQVTDTNISNNTISRINDAGSTSVVDCTNTEVSITAPIVKVNALPNRNSPDQYVSRISSTGQLYNSSVPYSRRATITDVVVPIGTADGIVYASLIYTPTGIYGRVGDIIEFTFSSIAGFDDVGSETDLFIGGHLIPSIGGGVNLLKGTVCLTSLVGPTYKYTVTYNNTTTGTTRLYTGSFVGPAILSGLGVNLRTASFPATTVAITIDFGFLQLNRLNQAT